ncbi:actin maturation protease isoform X3 [Mobula hypostoma]|uniref:actin maturation protease isoform X3 n=1 Tax=Mobula hypostoma TaxID=723540 RepID=UPI002FC31AF0
MSQQREDNPVISSDSQGSQLPPPPPPPPPPPEFSNQSLLPAKRLYQVLAKGQLQQRSDREELKKLLQNRSNSFGKELNWLLINAPIPSMIQDGPQCGLVALWMAGHLLNAPQPVSLEDIVNCAIEKNYTAQGEMFSGDNMVKLAKEVFACHGEVLSGGLLGINKTRILLHLKAGYPVLIPYPCKLLTDAKPAQTGAAAHGCLARCRLELLNLRKGSYDEDFNHEPCLRKGHRAHWAVVSVCCLLHIDCLLGAFTEYCWD